MLLFIIAISLLSFIFAGAIGMFGDFLRKKESTVAEHLFADRINKEKYLEEAGFNVMNDPW